VLALTFADRSWLARRWRSLVFVSCSAVFAGMAATSVITKKSGSLFVACMLLIVASGSTIPWEPRGQAAFNIVPVLALAIGAPHSRDGFDDFQWVEILTAGLWRKR
jgi:hypothetical protein